MNRQRLDKLMVDRGLALSRERASILIKDGQVYVSGRRADKPSTMVDSRNCIELRGEGDFPYVSRGGLKLKSALEHFGLNPEGLAAMDIGASTGGFTDCLLKNGASKVYAVDVGYGIIDWRLRTDPRVVLIERTNIRYLERGAVKDSVDLITIDVSFISLTKVLGPAREFLQDGGLVLALVKPQFEAGREHIGKGGIVRDERARLGALSAVSGFSVEAGFVMLGDFECPHPGQKGNIEYFIYLKKG